MKPRRHVHEIALFILVILHLGLSLLNISKMNEYVDYDEGTYLLIARLINNGYYPYRDIFAVHPPLYYYLLAFWLKIFGDSYIMGRLLSIVLGIIAVVLAYFVGLNLRSKTLGIMFSMAVALDPTLLRINMLVLHDSLIEAFTLASLYFFTRYLMTKQLRWACLSLVIAGLASTVKFTILPYLVALFLVLILSLDEDSWGYVKSGLRVILSEKQIILVLILYLFITSISVSFLMSFPSYFTRNVLVVLGVHPPTLVWHKYTGLLIVIAWLALTIYVFNCKYISKLAKILTASVRHWKEVIFMAISVVLAKVAIEIPLGYLISSSYFTQTYLSQSGRYLPFIGIFSVINKILSNLQAGKPEFILGFVPFFFLGATILLISLKGTTMSWNSYLSLLLILNTVMYLLIFPILPNIRFMNPLLLVFYLFIFSSLVESNISPKKFAGIITITILFFSMVDFGLILNYPSGSLELAWAVNTNTLRYDARAYLSDHPCNLTFSVNPMNAYYMDLDTVPYVVDSFGMLYLNGYPPSEFIHDLQEYGVDCIITSTWMAGAMSKSSRLYNVYAPIQNFVLINGSLLFSESFSNGDFISIFRVDDTHLDASKALGISSRNGKLAIWRNVNTTVYVYPTLSDISFNKQTVVRPLSENAFSIIWYSPTGRFAEGIAILNKTSIFIRILSTQDINITVEFEGIAVSANGALLSPGDRVNAVELYTNGQRFTVTGRLYYEKNGRLEAGSTILLATCQKT